MRATPFPAHAICDTFASGAPKVRRSAAAGPRARPQMVISGSQRSWRLQKLVAQRVPVKPAGRS